MKYIGIFIVLALSLLILFSGCVTNTNYNNNTQQKNQINVYTDNNISDSNKNLDQNIKIIQCGDINCDINSICLNKTCVNINNIENYSRTNEELIKSGKGFEQLLINPEKNNIMLLIIFGPFDNIDRYLFVSEDYGKTWNKSIPLNQIEIDKINPKFVYGTYFNEIYRSEDYGITFTKFATFSDESSLRPIYSDRFISKKIYVGVNNNQKYGIYISNDGGNTFEFSDFTKSIYIPENDLPIINNRIIWSIDQDLKNPNIIYATGEQASHIQYPKDGNGKLLGYNYDAYYTMRTFDGGNTWEPISQGLDWHSNIITNYIDNNNNTKWISFEEGPGLFVLNKDLNKWEKRNTYNDVLINGIPSAYLISPFDSAKHFIASTGKIYLTYDNGNSYLILFDDSYLNQNYVSSLATDSNGNLYATIWQEGLIKFNGLAK